MILFMLASAAFRAFYDPHFQCEAGWRSCDHRAFECAVQDNKEVSDKILQQGTTGNN